MPIYGTQRPPMPGQANVGYGPAGGIFDTNNPVYETPGGLRPGNAAGVAGTARPTGPYAQPAWQNAPQRPYAWTAAGRQLASAEQLQYGADLYGNKAATGGLAGSIVNGGNGTQAGVSTGINIGMPTGQLGASRQSLWNPAAGQRGLSLAQQGELGQQYNRLMTPMLQRSDLELSRGAAEQFAAMQRQMQVGRANAGLGWANLGQRINEIGMDDVLGQQGLQTDRLRLIQSILAGGI